MKNILIIIVVAIAAYFGIQYFTNQSDNVTEIKTTQNSESTIEPNTEVEVPEGAYVVQEDQSSITWEGKKVTGGHVGTVDIKSGYMTEDYQGEFVMDMTTIYTADGEAVTSHLKSDDFFSVETYPESRFVVTGYTEGSLEGELTIKGITKQVSIPAEVIFEDDTLTITSDYQMDRTDYDITFRSGSFFENLGDNLINDMFDLRVEVVAKR